MFSALPCSFKYSSCSLKLVKSPLKKLVRYLPQITLITDILFEENIPAWKTRSGSRMDEKAQAIQRGESVGKRNSDTTLQQDENVEKAKEQNTERAAAQV